MPGAPREPDDATHDPDPCGPDELDRRDVPILGGAGPILAILALTLLALLSVQLAGTR